MANEINEEILQAIDTISTSRINNASFDKTIEGRILASLGNNSYAVLINGQSYSMSSYGTTTFSINDTVNILYPQNKIDKAYIIPKGGSSGGGTSAYVLPVASNSLGGIKSGTDITVDSFGDVSVNDDSHNHIIANIDGLQTALDGKLASSSYTASDILTKIKTVDGSGSGLDADTLDGNDSSAFALKNTSNIYSGEQKFQNLTYCPTVQDNATGIGCAYKATRGSVNQEIVGQIILPNTTATDVDHSIDNEANVLKIQKITTVDASKPVLTNIGQFTENGWEGNSATANKLTTARTISLTGDVTGYVTFDGSTDTSITTIVADDSHNHIINNVDGLQTALNSKVDDSQVLTNVPANALFTDTVYTLPISSNTILGGIKIGANLTIGTDGTLNANDNPSSFIVKQENFIATAGQTVFTLTKGTYLPNCNRMFWYWNFVKQENSTLNETSSTTVTFPDGMIDAGDEILLEYIEVINSHPYPIHASEHLTGGVDPISVATQIADGLMLATDKLKLDSIEQGALANKIEVVQQNGTALTITNKTVNVIIPTKTSDITNDNNFITTSASITGNSATATKLSTARTISLTGDVTGSVSFDGSANKSITAIVVDDSHNHVISNVDGLQTALDLKIDNSRINDNGTTTELWTASKIQSEITSNLPTGVLQYNGTISTVPTTVTMDIPTMTDYKSNGIEVLLLRGTRWDRAIHSVDYVYGFTSATQLEIEFLNVGTYKVNYAFVSTGNVSFTVMSDTQPTDQNTNDFWYEILG